jgi:hypothetical protein
MDNSEYQPKQCLHFNVIFLICRRPSSPSWRRHPPSPSAVVGLPVVWQQLPGLPPSPWPLVCLKLASPLQPALLWPSGPPWPWLLVVAEAWLPPSVEQPLPWTKYRDFWKLYHRWEQPSSACPPWLAALVVVRRRPPAAESSPSRSPKSCGVALCASSPDAPHGACGSPCSCCGEPRLAH